MNRTLARYGNNGGTPGSSNVPWTKVTGAVVSGLTDPDSLTSASSYDSTTGLFSFTTSAAILQRDGRNEALAQRSIPVATLYPSFAPATDVIEVLWDIVSFPDTTGTWGIGIGVFDGPATSYATWGGQRAILFDSSGAAQATIAHANGGILGGNTIVATPLAFAASFRFLPNQPSGAGCQLLSQVKISTGWRSGTAQEINLLDSSVPTYIAVGLGKVGTAALAGQVLSGYLYTRRIRASLSYP